MCIDMMSRLFRHEDTTKKKMENTPGTELSDKQFGFRRGRSTVDALDRVGGIIYKSTNKGHFAMAIGLDVKNAFNTIPWPAIRDALRRKGFPPYIRRILDHYLFERTVEFPVLEGTLVRRAISSGIPQGSVLGPLLWNLTFNYILERVRREPGGRVICFADDTMILAVGKTVAETRSRANNQVEIIVRRIETLGLRLAEEKTEAVLFYGKVKPDISPVIRVGRTYVSMSKSMRYLGVILDSGMTFLPHFSYIRNKVAGVIRALARLMPNLRGPGERKRRSYALIVESIVLYGAPIWGQALLESRMGLRMIRNIQRPVANRVCAAYRTVSRDAAMLLARRPPYELVAEERSRVYDRCAELRDTTNWTAENIRKIRAEEKLTRQRKWIAMYDRRGGGPYAGRHYP